MHALKNIGSVLLGLALIAGLMLLSVILIYGIAWVSYRLFDYIVWANIAALIISVAIFLPLALFRTTRVPSVIGFYCASFVFGACVWIYGFLITLKFWGTIGILIGLVLGLVGVVPLGIIAAAIHFEWTTVGELFFGLGLTYGARFFALWLAAKVDAANLEKATKPTDSEIISNESSKRKDSKLLHLQADEPTAAAPLIAAELINNIEDTRLDDSQVTDWFVSVNGKVLGPAKFTDLKQLASRGVLPRDVQVRQSGKIQWLSAGGIPHLFTADSNDDNRSQREIAVTESDRLLPQQQPTKLPVTQNSNGGRSHKWNNYIARHWRGELSLPLSYWINGFLANIAAIVAVAIISSSADLKDNFRPEIALLSITLIWSTLFVILIWQFVGVWRSATNYRSKNPAKYWGGFAKFIMVLGLLRAAADFTQRGIPQINEFYKIYAGDEEVGKYAFRVLRDGQELEFSGGITFGAAKEFERFVDALGALKVVHLNSLGGRILEAQHIGDIITRRGLITYAPFKCESACTIIFLSGRERLITANSKIGFHQPDFPGLTEEERRTAIAEEQRRLVSLGVGAEFARKANLAAPGDMWFPQTGELLAAHVATRIVDPSNFAISGINPTEFSREKLDAELSKINVYASVKKVDPDTFAAILSKFEDGVRKGNSLTDLRSEISPLVMRVFNKALPYSSDENLISFAKFTIKIGKTYNKEDPEACYFYFNPDKGTVNLPDRFYVDNKNLATEEQELQARIIGAYSDSDVKLPTAADVSGSSNSVMSAVKRVNPYAFDALKSDNMTPDKYSAYCAGIISTYEEALKLPKNNVAELIRFYLIPGKNPKERNSANQNEARNSLTGLPIVIKAAVLKEMDRAACNSSEIPESAIVVADLNGDHIPDYAIDYSSIPCGNTYLAEALQKCGTGGCSVGIWMSERASWHFLGSSTLRGIKKGRPRQDGRDTLFIATHGISCNQVGYKSCFYQVWWSGEKFEQERVAGRKCAPNEQSWECEVESN